MVKYGCVLLGHRTLKFAIPKPKNKLIKLIFCMLKVMEEFLVKT